MHEYTVLVTGTLSGLGRSVHETLGGIGWTRQLPTHEERNEIKRRGVDVIIHCAVNARRSIDVDSDNLYGYVADNVLLTEELQSIPHQKFIYISTTAVYPPQLSIFREEQVIQVDAVDGIYATTKLISEAIVRTHCPNLLILRLVAPLGRYSRKNSLIRILDDEPCTLTLAADSTFNYVLHSDVCDFIRFAIATDIQGIYNVASKGNLTLSDIAAWQSKKLNFGGYRHDIGNVDNTKIAAIFPAFRKTSREVVAQFIQERINRATEMIESAFWREENF